MLTTDQKGALAETAIMHAAIKSGAGVYKRVMEGGRYDVVLDAGSELLRVQCKWAPRNGDVMSVRCYSCRRAREGLRKRVYTAAEVDVIAAYCQDVNRCFLLTAEQFDGRHALQLRLSPCRTSHRLGINWAEDVAFDARLRALVGP
ncbi:MAG TPA: group I intron-associated PD-(D/E)XK endonuclease [Gaiellaceae bacterium]|nr:group I intron-associated PD-(D/E)XK endonuclease [Gaiellaceae bacterium]